MKRIRYSDSYQDEVITPEELRAVLDYYHDDGVLYWKRTVSRSIVAGSRAGSYRVKKNRVIVGYRGKLLDAAELAIFLHTGRIPEFPVKFKDGNPRNLKFSNLVEDVIW